MEADYVEAGTTRLFVRRWVVQGAPSVLYWHGGGGGSDEWPELAPALESGGFSVYAPDAPGYGESPALGPDEYGASNVATIAIRLIDHLGISPTIWIGFSWGANLGVHVAAQAPDRLKALALLDGGYLAPGDHPEFDPAETFEERRAQIQAEIEEGTDWDAPADVLAAAMSGSTAEPAAPLLPFVAAADLPILLVAATRPSQYNAARARALVRFQTVLPSASIHRVEAGHGVLVEAGDEVRRLLIDWLWEIASP